MDAVLATGERLSSPVIVQVSVRTVNEWGPQAIHDMFRMLRSQREVQAVLHLDHCSDPNLVTACMEAEWDSALVDVSDMLLAKAINLTRDLVRRGADRGFDIEGEIQAIGSAADAPPVAETVDVEASLAFVGETGVACFSPAIGTAHGQTRGETALDWVGLRNLAEALDVPLVMHGASGLENSIVKRLVNFGVAKVNYSTALKAAFRKTLDQHVQIPFDDPLQFSRQLHHEIGNVVTNCIDALGSKGQACAEL